MKKVLIASGVAVLALAMVAGAATYTFNTNLTVGSTGADVSALQSALMAAGYNIPAIASGAAQPGYFGSQTKAAVAAYQVANGIINPGTGFFGPLTRAKMNGTSVVVAPVTCPVGYICTPTSGGAPVVGTPGVITTVGAEGLITTKLASSPIADSNIRVASNVPVWGVEVKAQGSDMIVDRVLIQMAVGVGGAATNVSNPATFVKTLYAYDGSTLLKSWNLSAADFNKDTSDRYYVIASGMRFVVPKDTTKVLTFVVDTTGVASDMSSRYLTVQGYAGNTQNVRAVDGANMNSYTDMSGSANSRVQVFTTSGSSTVTVTVNSALTPKATTNRVTSDGVKGLTMQAFDVKSETGASVIKKIYAVVNATSTTGIPSTLYLYDGSTLLSSVSPQAYDGTAIAFSDLTVNIAKDTTKTFTIKADFASTVSGQAASTSVAANGVQWEKPDSTTASTTNSELAANDQYLYSQAPKWELISKSNALTTEGTVGVSSSTLTAVIVLKATAMGGAMTKPVASDFGFAFASSTATTYNNSNSIPVLPLVQVEPNDATVGDGGVYTVTLSGKLSSATSSAVYSPSSADGYWEFGVIKSISSTVGSTVITNQTWGIDTFYTTAVPLPKGTF